jgi:hypothetical protein
LVKFVPRYFNCLFLVGIVTGISIMVSSLASPLLVYRMAAHFCLLILYPATLLNSFSIVFYGTGVLNSGPHACSTT